MHRRLFLHSMQPRFFLHVNWCPCLFLWRTQLVLAVWHDGRKICTLYINLILFNLPATTSVLLQTEKQNELMDIFWGLTSPSFFSSLSLPLSLPLSLFLPPPPLSLLSPFFHCHFHCMSSHLHSASSVSISSSWISCFSLNFTISLSRSRSLAWVFITSLALISAGASSSSTCLLCLAGTYYSSTGELLVRRACVLLVYSELKRVAGAQPSALVL